MMRRLLIAALLLVGAALPAAAQQVVLVPARVIYPGETIVPEALRAVTLQDGRVPPAGVAFRAESLDGKVARRTLVPGRYVPEGALREAYLVETGKPARAVFSAGGLTITTIVVALQPGAAGDLVRLRNPDSGKVITGTVMADGTVLVGAS